MASSFLLLSFFILFTGGVCCEAVLKYGPYYFSFDGFETTRTFFWEMALYGDAKVNASAVSLTRQRPPAKIDSWGAIMNRSPIRFPSPTAVFSTSFSFSISDAGDRNGSLAFFLAPTSAPIYSTVRGSDLIGRGSSVMEVEFVANGEVSIKSRDLSVAGAAPLALNGGEKLSAWIDYDGNSKTIEVRVSESSEPRPINASISLPIDLSDALGRETMLAAISSSYGNSTWNCWLYSWSFGVKDGAPRSAPM